VIRPSPSWTALFLASIVGCGDGDASGDPPVVRTVTTTETVPLDCFADADADGFGDVTSPGACGEGLVANASDCDDTDPTAGGGAEVPYNERDDDCSSLTPDDDLDGDGWVRADDCDDADPQVGGPEVPYDGLDNDCDPATADDDLDGDGVGSALDCDDADATVGDMAFDGDCDGLLVGDDCDDADAGAPSRSEDADCDGWLTADDCDDTDPAMPGDDADCDGWATADDCDDSDPSSTHVGTDADCDGVAADVDCDDTDASRGSYLDDLDCDGAVGPDDCDDTDATIGRVDDDADCDGVPTADDCDDGSADVGSVDTDADCDGIPNDDLREGDVTLLSVEDDAPFADDVVGRGNVDGDGLADLLITDFDAGFAATPNNAGEVYVLTGSHLSTLSGDHVVDEAAEWVLYADQGLHLVRDADWVDDADGDGVDDLWVVISVAPGSPTGSAFRIGSASLGGSGRVSIASAASLVLTDPITPEHVFGRSARVGDIDGDGVGEVILSQAATTYSALPAVQVVMSTGLGVGSPARHRLYGPGNDSGTGEGVMVDLGDLDGDGLSEVAVGAHQWGGNERGQLYFVFGDTIAASPDLWLGDADASVIGTEGGQELGRGEVAAVDDLDGDGIRDLLVGDFAESRVLMLSGGQLSAWQQPVDDVAFTTLTGSANVGDWFGWQVDPVGDLDADGLVEVAVAAPEDKAASEPDASEGGALWMVPGSVLGAGGVVAVGDVASARYAGDGEAGYEMAAAGDVDGDGLVDLVVAAPEASGGGSAALLWGAGLLP